VLALGRRAPSDYAKLRASYETILATRLQGTGFGQAALVAMLDPGLPYPLPGALTCRAGRLVDQRTARHLDLATIASGVFGRPG
jgi:hypothetical protein